MIWNVSGKISFSFGFFKISSFNWPGLGPESALGGRNGSGHSPGQLKLEISKFKFGLPKMAVRRPSDDRPTIVRRLSDDRQPPDEKKIYEKTESASQMIDLVMTIKTHTES